MLFIYFVLSVAGGFVILHANSLLGQIFNFEFLTQNLRDIIFPFLLTASLFVISFLANTFNAYLSEKMNRECGSKVKEYFILKLLHADSKYFKDKPAPGIWSKLNAAGPSAVSAFFLGVDSITYFVRAIFLAIIVFSVSFYAGIFSILVVPLHFFAMRKFGSAFAMYGKDIMEVMREKAIVAEEAITNVSNIKSKNAYAFFTARIMKFQHKNANLMRKINVSQHILERLGGLFAVLAPIIVIFLVAQFSDVNNISTGDLIVLFINVPLFVVSFAGFNNMLINYNRFKPSIEHLKELNAIAEEPSGANIINSFEYLESKDVSVQYGDRVINVPDLRINKREKVMFMGESGVGKSTLFNILVGILHDYKGSVTINGMDLKSIDLASLRDVFGIAFQSVNVATLTLKDNILLGMNDDFNKIDEVIEISELSKQYNEKGEQILNANIMSGGEKSRLGLAQLLVRDYDIILIDETFSSVDEDMEALIIERLFGKFPDKTFVCISHRASSKRFFDRVVEFR
ncbi:MAG: ABC transporter ATP-binding protein/permease [Defluviitaleaceae bacterium]|nr:ABC transporter ATP-binding protein/permease [Defluviitaleaceae bacterium]